MIDAPDVVRDFLITQSSITALVGNRIWAELATPPQGYTPSQGAAIAFKTRSGPPLDYSGAILHSSWQFKFYGASVMAARTLYRTCADVLFDASLFGAPFQSAIEVEGQTIPEPDTDWPVVLAFFETWMRSGLPTYTPT